MKSLRVASLLFDLRFGVFFLMCSVLSCRYAVLYSVCITITTHVWGIIPLSHRVTYKTKQPLGRTALSRSRVGILVGGCLSTLNSRAFTKTSQTQVHERHCLSFSSFCSGIMFPQIVTKEQWAILKFSHALHGPLDLNISHRIDVAYILGHAFPGTKRTSPYQCSFRGEWCQIDKIQPSRAARTIGSYCINK